MRRRSAAVPVIAALCLVAACAGEGPLPTSPADHDGTAAANSGRQVGTIVVKTATTGSDLDPNGYTVAVDGSGSKAAGINSSVKFPNVSAGTRTITLSGIAANCTTNNNPRSVTLATGSTVTVTFSVTCATLSQTGSLTVSTATTGSDLDPDGYTATVDGDGASAKPVGVNGSVTFTGLGAGSHTVELSGLATNCTTSDSPQTVTVTAGSTVTAPITVTCQALATTGTLAVTAATTGSDLDPDGYTITVDDAQSQDLASNGSASFAGLPPGSHVVALSGTSVAPNCTVSSANPQTVNVTAGATVTATFNVTCSAVPTSGNLTVRTTSTGSDIDADGYTATVDGSTTSAQAVGVNDSVTFNGLSAGSHTVVLSGLASNCTTDNTQTVTVSAGATARAAFAVTCQAVPTTGSVTVSTATTGSDIDPDGYTATLDGTTSQSVASNGGVTFENLSAGSHTVALSGLAPNCTTTTNPQTVTVTAGSAAHVAFNVTCQATTGALTVSATTAGSDLDSDGYTASVDGGPGQAIGANGSATFTGLSAGSHALELSALASNCTTTNNPRTISVTAGTTAQAAFAVNCTPVTGSSYTLVGAGDIAGCTWEGDEATARLLDAIPGTVVALGDNAYPDGGALEYANCYHPTWGRHKARTYAALGNHEYQSVKDSGDATPAWDYFGDRAGPRGLGYYSFDLGDWHIIVLNDNSYYGGPYVHAGSKQDQWLQADLAASTKRCTIAIWHQPYVASGWATSTSRKIFWDRLYAAGAEIVLSGHKHHYERMAPQTPDLVRDDARGLRAFVVGTGGAATVMPTPRAVNSEVVSNSRGVLKLTLSAGSYAWQFIPVAGQTFTDSGSGTCH
jgi:hypothetical protein